MIVTLIYKEKLNTITLPNKKEGQFWLGTDEEKEIISKWLTKVASYYELNDKLTNIVSILSQNENNLKYLNRIFLSNEGEVNEN